MQSADTAHHVSSAREWFGKQIYDCTEPIEIEQRANEKPIIMPIGKELGYGQVMWAWVVV